MRLKAVALALVALFAWGCTESPQSKAYWEYKNERKLVLICRDGTKIWEWRRRFWVEDRTQSPDAEVTDPNKVCR